MRAPVPDSFWQQHYGEHVSQLDTRFCLVYIFLIAGELQQQTANSMGSIKCTAEAASNGTF
jgi:hypothetical protein